MKLLLILTIGVTIFLSGCCTSPKENYQQAFDADLSEATLSMKTLHALDSGDMAKTRRTAMIPVFVDICSLPEDATNSHPTPEQKQELTALAKDVLEYLSTHRHDFDQRKAFVAMCIRGLRKILTEPEDIHHLQELSDYYEAQKP